MDAYPVLCRTPLLFFKTRRLFAASSLTPGLFCQNTIASPFFDSVFVLFHFPVLIYFLERSRA